jgi:hypothetical protein
MNVEFQRLASVRARRSSRRRRWVAVLSAVAGVAVIGALALPALDAGAPRVHEAQGRVATVEPQAGIIRVSSGLFGLMSVALVVTSDTLIVVGDKEGGFGDIREGERVIAAYEARPDALRAKRVEVFVQSLR